MMSSNSKVLAMCALVASFGVVNAAYAASYSIFADVSDGPSGYTADAGPGAVINVEGDAGVYQVDFYLQSSGYVAGERGFAFTTFDVTLTDLTNTTTPGWLPDTLQVSDGTGTVDLWDENEDLGPDDLQEIIAAIAVIPSPDVDDERPDATYIGSGPVPVPTFIGSLMIDYDGTSDGILNGDIVSTGHVNDADGEWVNDTSTSTKFNVVVNFATGVEICYDGDANGDLLVNSADLILVKNNFGVNALGDAACPNDGVTNSADLIAVKNNFGADYNPGLSFVPEPASVALLALGGLFTLRRRHA